MAGVERDGSRTLLASALTTLARPVGEEYRFTAVGGTTQARVWRGTPTRPGSAPQVALRLTPKPIDLIRRISVLTNHLHDTDQVHQAGQVGGVGRVQCPRTLAVEDLRVEGRRWTVQLCTWIGTGPVPPGRPEGSGRRPGAPARGDEPIEHGLQRPALELQFPWFSHTRSAVTAATRLAGSARAWQDRIPAWPSFLDGRLPVQPIHGDLHWGNLVQTTTGFAFIDFDKVMSAPPVFDLAKLIATGLFHVGGSGGGEQVRFQARRARDLLNGYTSVRALTEDEFAALECLVLQLNEETAHQGQALGNPEYIARADAVARWWIARSRRTRHNPLGIRAPGP